MKLRKPQKKLILRRRRSKWRLIKKVASYQNLLFEVPEFFLKISEPIAFS